MTELPWFRMYANAVDNAKLRLLAFEDRWHYVAILCMKRSGLLDEKDAELRDRKIALKLGVARNELDEIKRRLHAVSLVTKDLSPVGWREHQFESDTSTIRTRKYRERLKKNGRSRNVTGTSQRRHSDGLDTDTDTEQIKNLDISNDISCVGQPKNGRPNGQGTYLDRAQNILDFLNRKTGRNWQAKSPNGKPTAHATLLINLFRKGFDDQSVKAVIARKHREWNAPDNADKMAQYVRPSTLFRASHFETYLGECVTS